MARGLLAAAASSLIVSLWQLPDQSTATLMQNFYTQLLAVDAGRFTAVQLAQALQAAQKQAIAENHPPRDWAGLAFVYS
jgi:CHAT domain-containing protein